MSLQVPDAIAPLVGYREWHAWTDLEGNPVLMSLYRPSVWPRGDVMRANCLKSDVGLWLRPPSDLHRAPSEHCQCGIYAYRTPDFEPCAQSTPHRYVSGVVVGWGRYILCTHGWRTEYAKPVAVLASNGIEDWVTRAAELYGLDVLHQWPKATKAS